MTSKIISLPFVLLYLESVERKRKKRKISIFREPKELFR